MYRSQLQHVILEIGRRFDLSDFHIVESAAILAALPNPPEGALTATRTSDFDLEHGYYVQGVTSTTPTYAPSDWKARAVPIRVEKYTGWCMEGHDLVLSKLGAGREKDIDFARSAADLGLLQHEELLRRLQDVPCSDEHRRQIEARVNALFT